MAGVKAAAATGDVVSTVLLVLVRWLLLAGWWLLRRPALLAAVLLLGIAFSVGGWPAVSGVSAAVAAMLLGWRLAWPESFRRLVAGPWSKGRARHTYRRRWARAADLCGLVKRREGVVIAPRLGWVRIGGVSDRLAVRLVMGQSIADYERACPELAAAFAAMSARVRENRPGRVVVELVHADALVAPVAALPVPAEIDLRSVAVGVREDGGPWWLGVLATHVFVGGVTGSGKGSVIWSLIRGLCPAVRTGLVQLWAVDPKGGMELGFGRPLFARFAAGSTEVMVTLLEQAVTVMDARCVRLAGLTRLHTPTVVEPLIVMVVDELSTLTAYEPDVKLRNRATAAISGLLARGRAVGVMVIAAAQDPRKEVVSFRSLFPTRVALRLDTPVQVDMVLGDGMHEMGAAADRIPASTPGVGYVAVEGVREPVRVRAGHVTDDDILTMAADFAPAPVQTAATVPASTAEVIPLRGAA